MSRDHIVMRYFEHRLAFEDESALRHQGLKRHRRISVWSAVQAAQLVVDTTMIATVPLTMARQLEARLPVRVLPFPFPQEPMRNFVYWHPSREQDSVVRGFVTEIQKGLEDESPPGA